MLLVGWSLLRAVEQGLLRAELDARIAARELAQALRAVLRAPAVLQLVPAEQRFAVRDGALVVPAEIGWLRPLPPAPADPVVAEKLREAQVAEFARGDAAAATALHDELLGPRGPQGDAALPVIAAAAWQAHRATADERCAALLAQLDTAFADAAAARTASPTVADAVAATTLLASASALPRAAWIERLLPALPDELVRPVLARMVEHGADVAALQRAAAVCSARRRLLGDLAAILPGLGTGPLFTAHHGRLLLWFPGDAGGGDGALTTTAFLASLCGLGTARPAPVVGLPAVPDRTGVVFTAPPVDAEEVLPGFAWVVPQPPPAPSLLARPGAVLAAALVLVLVFAASAGFGVRALRQQTLAVRARAEFLTVVTHELKTPVASIRLMAEVLAGDEVPPPKQREYFALLAGESARLTMLIENVLDLGQMDRGERAYDLRPGDLAQVVREAVALFRPLALRSGMEVDLREGTSAAPGIVDSGALLQALLNMFDNARKYAAAGRRIEVVTAVQESSLLVTVRDFGPGVPALERELIFERFRRGAAHRHGSIPGVGLGLHLARVIVRRHGGELRCVAPPDGSAGALFECALPMAAEGGAEAPA